MAHGSTPLQTRPAHSFRRAWLAALRRGLLLGVVVSVHLGALLLLLGPVMPYQTHVQTHVQTQSRPDHSLQLQIKLVANVIKLRPIRRLEVHSALIKQVTRRTAVRTAPATTTAAFAPTVTPVGPPIVAGDYRSPLLGNSSSTGMPSTIPPLPGSVTSRVPGIVLDKKPSMKQFVRKLAKASRCGYERMKMRGSPNQFITGQLMDRALEADGCGPSSAPRTQADDTVDAISHRAIFGD